jgi:hypothetical protein
MEPYTIALFVHLFCVLLATAASAMAFQGALFLRAATNLEEACTALSNIRRIVPAFPFATLGLLASGGYMTRSAYSWTAPWILASIAGLVAITVLGSVIEAGRLRALAAELAANGYTDKARRLTRDPVAWTAKLGTVTLVFGIVLEMTLKPAVTDAAAIPVAAVIVAVPLALPFWRVRPVAPAAAPSRRRKA